MRHYTMLSIYGNCTHLLKIKNKLKIGQNSRYFVGVINKTIIPLVFVRYEVIIDYSALRTSLATQASRAAVVFPVIPQSFDSKLDHLISNAHAWNNCFKIVIENIG